MVKLPWGIMGVAGLGYLVGGATAYVLTKNYIEKKMSARFEDEMYQTKLYYGRLNKKGQFSNPVYLATEYSKDGAKEVLDEDVAEPLEEEEYPGWDIEEEKKNRSDDRPYVISEWEYKHTQVHYTKTDLTYYVNDDIVIDGGTVPYPDVDGLLGDDNLQRFGHGARSKNIVCIRNDELETDFEIGRSEGDFSDEVLGYIKHAHSRGRGKVMKMLREEE